MMKQLSFEFRTKQVPIVFGWLDGGCYPDILEKIGLSESALPSMALYAHSKQQVSTTSGDMTLETTRELVLKLLVGQAEFNPVTGGLELAKRSCKAFRKEFEAAGTDDERASVLSKF